METYNNESNSTQGLKLVKLYQTLINESCLKNITKIDKEDAKYTYSIEFMIPELTLPNVKSTIENQFIALQMLIEQFGLTINGINYESSIFTSILSGSLTVEDNRFTKHQTTFYFTTESK